MPQDIDITKTLDTLIDGWCERRAIRPLQYLLLAYPGPLAHTDQQYELLDALKDVKGLCRDDLTPDERQKLNDLHNTWKILSRPETSNPYVGSQAWLRVFLGLVH